MSTITVFLCPPSSYEEYVSSLIKLHIRCIEAGAELSFILPIQHEKMHAHWNSTLPNVLAQTSIAFLAVEEGTKELLGCVFLTPAWQPNAPHRAAVTKLLVDPSTRGRYAKLTIIKK
jgi:hypothetical protein